MITFNFEKAKWHQDSEGTWISFKVDRNKALEILSELKDKVYTCTIKLFRKDRSLDSNSYYWVLCGKLSAKLRIPPEQIYRQHIKDIGDNYEILPLKDVAVEKFRMVWSEKGIGWLTDIIGPSKHEGYTNVMAYYGSSTYDSSQMSRLISLMVDDCNDNDIEVMTPAEIERLNSMWKEDKNG